MLFSLRKWLFSRFASNQSPILAPLYYNPDTETWSIGGGSREDALASALAKAQELNKAITLDFNGVSISVYPGEDPMRVGIRFGVAWRSSYPDNDGRPLVQSHR